VSEADPVLRDLARLLHGRWLLVGVGNDLRGDDAFGPLLARRLLDEGIPAIDAGSAPENVTGPILRAAPDLLILADAACMGAEAGTLRLLEAGALAEGGTSTHDPSLATLLAYLQGRHPGGTPRPPLDVKILAFEPTTRDLGAPPSHALLASIDRLMTDVFAREGGEHKPAWSG
jgi:hydrogenase 3 maturation protease